MLLLQFQQNAKKCCKNSTKVVISFHHISEKSLTKSQTFSKSHGNVFHIGKMKNFEQIHPLFMNVVRRRDGNAAAV